MSRLTLYKFLLLFFALSLMTSCKSPVHIGEKEIVEKPAEINNQASDIIKESLKDLLQNQGHIKDVPAIKNISVLDVVYHQNDYEPIWTSNGKWKPVSDSLLSFINHAKVYGLFPDDYYAGTLSDIRSKLISDTASNENKLDAALWAEADLRLTSAFVQIIKDVKAGRILPDSVLLKNDSALNNDLFLQQLHVFQQGGTMTQIADSLEPANMGYQKLKSALQKFLVKADFKKYTYVNEKDSLHLNSLLLKRLREEDSVKLKTVAGDDSIQLASSIKHYQKRKGLKLDGKVTPALINQLNQNDYEKFIRIAIALDRYKQLPREMPAQYIWVNIPGYYMQVKENDSVCLVSKVVVGKPQTRTPVLTSAITDMITYPQWTIPTSIIKKDVLPGLKKDPGYCARKGFSLIDKEGNEVNPYTVKWSKYESAIPYKVVQGSGDDNALGVMKFNFSNKYSVYLHDTNQRYLFSKKSRALSHGCVRVESWDSLAYYILRNDSAVSAKAVSIDSVQTWLALKQKHVIPVHKKIPLFIRYFTCDVKGDKIIFYEDVYGEDRRLKEKYFANKN